MEQRQENYLLSTDRSRLQVSRIHAFLSKQAYWCLDIPEDVVKRAIENSLCFGLYDLGPADQPQIGFARVVTDAATFAWICDVYIETEHRGRGLSKWLTKTVLVHPDLVGLRRVCLATKDAHGLYAQYGFQVTQTPGNWMEIKDNEIYKKTKSP